MAVAKIIVVQEGKYGEIDLIEGSYTGTMTAIECADFLRPYLENLLSHSQEYKDVT
jgi:hypothetical protein